MKILVVEDHPKIRDNIIKYLKINSYLSEGAMHGEEALNKILNSHYDLMILDVNMPIMNGKELLKILKSNGKSIPTIALTSNNMLEDKLEMFDLGVADYITKPFELKELEARIKVIIKRNEIIKDDIISHGNIELNISKHKIFKSGKEIDLGNKEYLIVEFLIRNKGYVKSKISIFESVWGEAEENLNLNSTTFEAHISFIRKKLGKDFIKTIRGAGYIIE